MSEYRTQTWAPDDHLDLLRIETTWSISWVQWYCTVVLSVMQDHDHRDDTISLEMAALAAPPELELPDVPLGLDLHPTHNVCAIGLVSGEVRVSRFALEGHEQPFVIARPFSQDSGSA